MINLFLKLPVKILFFMLTCVTFSLLCFYGTASGDDTCMFEVSTDEVAPNIVFLLDNGAEMEQIKWHSDYSDNTDYTPEGASVEILDGSAGSGGGSSSNTTLVLTSVDESYPFDVNSDIEGMTSGAEANIAAKSYDGADLHLEVTSMTGTFTVGEVVRRYKNKKNIATGTLSEIIEPEEPEDSGDSAFLNENGYGMVSHGGTWTLVKILSSLEPDSYANGLDADSGTTWTINGRTLTLPADPSTSGQVDADTGFTIKDNATRFRYSKNYMNWLFYGSYSGDGSDLPDESRFYYAKQALLSVGKHTSNKANFGIYNFTSTSQGSSSVQPLGEVVAVVDEDDSDNNVLESNYENNINNMGTVTYSPLAEGLARIGGYYDSSSSGVEDETSCQDQYVIVVSSGIPSKDEDGASQYLPETLEDFDEDDSDIGEGNVKADSTLFTIPQNTEGSSWLDDVAHYMYTHDMVGYVDGFQNVMTYTVGVMTSNESNLYLTNTSNNGNGHQNLYDTTDSDYGDYHFTADSASELSEAIQNAVNAIISSTSTFTAPVVPVTRTLSGNRIYLSLFKPKEGNVWEGNVLKLGLDEDLNVVDKNGDSATESNGAIKEDAEYYWATINWANADYSTDDCDGEGCNYMENAERNIYTYMGSTNDLTDSSNAFSTDNEVNLTAAVLGNPSDGRNTLINYVRGADSLDDDDDGDIDENREIITGDVLHSEPVIFEYRYDEDNSETYVFFGANDGMIHAVYDQETVDGEETNYGTEAWGFVPADLLSSLKNLLEGSEHPIFVDSTPKIYFSDIDGDGFLDEGDQVILICGERKGGNTYIALDITDPEVPLFLWEIDDSDISELGETWSEPSIGLVKTSSGDTTGTAVMFIGGGYSSDNTSGKTILAIDVSDGSVVKQWGPDFNLASDSAMTYSIPSAVNIIDEDSNGFIDKLYVGDMGGRIWRVGRFTNLLGIPYDFPGTNENINYWEAQIVFQADSSDRKFYYAPRVTLEREYDLIFAGTGDREDACSTTSGPDKIIAFKDSHATVTSSDVPVPLTLTDLVNVTSASAESPDLDNPEGDVDNNLSVDNGWYFNLETGEKILAEGVVFFKTIYMTSFLPNDDPCLPGGEARLYALDYKTGKPVIDFESEESGEEVVLEPYKNIGGGIPSEPVVVISETGPTLFITIGSPTPDDDVDSDDQPGIIKIEPLSPSSNFFYQWWRETSGN